jgi:hypothetical protein
LIERSAAINKTHAHITPSEHGWIGASVGVRGLSFNYVVMQDECRVELYIVERFRRGKQTDVLSSCRLTAKPIEQAFGATLLWERLEGRRACRISYTRQGGGYRSPEEQWPQIQDKTIHDMDRLMKALQPFLKQLNVSS